MDKITQQTITNLVENVAGTAVSIYMPTFTKGRQMAQNPIRLKNLLDDVESQLAAKGMNEEDIETYLSPAADLVDDEVFWQNQAEGLALFLDETQLRIFRLPARFDELAVVDGIFHITPLIPIFSGNGQYYLLSLDLKKPVLYRGSKFKLQRFEDVDLPESLQAMFDAFYEFHSHLQFHSKTANPNPDSAGQRQGEYFGHGGDDIDKNAEIRNYFHRLDEALTDFLEDETVPMVLAGVAYLHPIFRAANTYDNLLETGITKDVDSLSAEDLHALSWQMVSDQFQLDLEKALDVYQSLKAGENRTSEAIEDIVPAAYFQRIRLLFTTTEAHVWGQFDPETKAVTLAEEETHKTIDLLSFAAAHTLNNGGKVFVLPAEDIPGGSDAAAILRY